MDVPSWLMTPRAVAVYTISWSVAFAGLATYSQTIGRGPVASRGWFEGLGPLLFLFLGLFAWRRGWKIARHLLLTTWIATASMFIWPVIFHASSMTLLTSEGPVLSWAVPLMAVFGVVGLLLTYAVLPSDTAAPSGTSTSP